MPDDASASTFHDGQAVVEPRGVPEVGVVHLERAGVDRRGVELAQKPDLRRSVVVGSPATEVLQVSLVGHHDQVPVAEPLGSELPRAVVSAVIAMVPESLHGARVRAITLVPTTGAC